MIRTLTATETLILARLSEGTAPRAIAKDMGLSVRTVEAHIFNIRRKLGIRGRGPSQQYSDAAKEMNVQKA